MPVCEKNVLEIPLSASTPAASDVVIFTLADGTSVIRPWSAFSGALVPVDWEYRVVLSGGLLNNGDSSIALDGTGGKPNFVGRRIRLIRGSIPQTTIAVTGGLSYSWNSTTGVLTFVPAVSTDEIIQVQAY